MYPIPDPVRPHPVRPDRVRQLGIELDEFIAMPNHLHGIIMCVGAPLAGALNNDVVDRAPIKGAPTTTLGEVIGTPFRVGRGN